MKMKKVSASNIIAMITMIVTIASTIWLGGFRLAEITHELKDLNVMIDNLKDKMDEQFEKIDKRFEKIEQRLDRIETDLHRTDLRVTTLEQKGR